MHSSFPVLHFQSFCPSLFLNPPPPPPFLLSPSGILLSFFPPRYSFLNSIRPLAYCLLIWLIQNTIKEDYVCGEGMQWWSVCCLAWLGSPISHGPCVWNLITHRDLGTRSTVEHTDTPFFNVSLTRTLAGSVKGEGLEKDRRNATRKTSTVMDVKRKKKTQCGTFWNPSILQNLKTTP